MISVAGVYAVTAGGYALALAALLAWLRGVAPDRRRFCYPVVGVVGLAAATTALSAAGVGVLQVGAGELDLPSVLDDLVGYSVLWVVAAALATESRRMLAVVAAIPAVQVLSFNVASLAGGVVGLLGLGVVVGGYGVVAYLFLGPIWDRVDGVAEERRLLHWKARNLLLFLIGMLIVFALLGVAGAFDAFVTAVLAEYLGALLRVGFAGFLFANRDALGEGASDGDPDASGGTGLDARAGASGDPVSGASPGTDADPGAAGVD